MPIEIEKTGANEGSFEQKVLCQFQKKGGLVYQGDFTAEFKRVDQNRIDDFLDDSQGWTNSAVLDEILIGVSGIGGGGGAELPTDEQIAWVKKTPECVNAAVTVFFRATRPERYSEKTSKRRPGRG